MLATPSELIGILAFMLVPLLIVGAVLAGVAYRNRRGWHDVARIRDNRSGTLVISTAGVVSP